MLYAAVDLGGTKIAGAVGTPDGALLAERTIPTEADGGPDHVIDRIAALVRGFGGSPAALGIGVPGLVDRATGEVLFLPNLATQWRGVPLARRLAAELGIPVRVLNDARAATLGEFRFGHSAPNMLLYTLGTGVGGGVIVDGRLRLGPLGAAGELGHQTMNPDGERCNCGSRGCLETIVSGPALARAGAALLGRPVTVAEMAALPECRPIFTRAGESLGLAVANMISALHPELVVFGGGLSALGDLLLGPVRPTVAARVRMFPADGVRLERSALGDRAGLLGALALASLDLT
jgi:glucokinase